MPPVRTHGNGCGAATNKSLLPEHRVEAQHQFNSTTVLVRQLIFCWAGLQGSGRLTGRFISLKGLDGKYPDFPETATEKYKPDGKRRFAILAKTTACPWQPHYFIG